VQHRFLQKENIVSLLYEYFFIAYSAVRHMINMVRHEWNMVIGHGKRFATNLMAVQKITNVFTSLICGSFHFVLAEKINRKQKNP